MFARRASSTPQESRLEKRIRTLDDVRLGEYIDSYLFELQSHWASWDRHRGTDSLASARLAAETLEVLLGTLYNRLEG